MSTPATEGTDPPLVFAHQQTLLCRLASTYLPSHLSRRSSWTCMLCNARRSQRQSFPKTPFMYVCPRAWSVLSNLGEIMGVQILIKDTYLVVD